MAVVAVVVVEGVPLAAAVVFVRGVEGGLGVVAGLVVSCAVTLVARGIVVCTTVDCKLVHVTLAFVALVVLSTVADSVSPAADVGSLSSSITCISRDQEDSGVRIWFTKSTCVFKHT